MTVTTSNLSANVAKALLFDVVITLGIVGIKSNYYETLSMLTHVFTGAFTAYTLRDIARDHKHPWIGGAIAGAIKYATKDGNPLLGAYNNAAYEYTKDNALGIENLEPIVIEGFEEFLGNSVKAYHNNQTMAEAMLSGANGLLFGGAIVGGSIVGLATVFFDPMKNSVESLPSLVVGATSTFALLNCGMKIGSNLGNSILEYYNEYNTLVHDTLVNATFYEHVEL